MLVLIAWSICLLATDTKQVQFDLAELNFELIKIFKAEYPSMVVQNLVIEPASNTNAKLGKFERIEISQGGLRQSSGMFSAVFSDGAKDARLFFRYKFTATIEMVRAIRDIPKDKLIEDSDIELSSIAFVSIKDRPMQKDDILAQETKRYIRAGGAIGSKDVAKRSVVKRGSVVSAVMVDGSFELEFEATALEDGAMGQSLSVKGKNGKIYKAVVVAPSRVEIR